MRIVRTLFQVGFVVGMIVVGLRWKYGGQALTCETYCPFGGLETAYSLLTQKRFTCATSEASFIFFLGMMGLVLLAKKSFCSWICPLGSILEWIGRLGHRIGWVWEPSVRIDRALRYLRYVVLVVILYFTYTIGDLIFRTYDPYYIFYSFGNEAVLWWSWILLAMVLVSALYIRMAWCRYLCPLGAVYDLFSRIGFVKPVVDSKTCTSCGLCEKACPQAIPIVGKTKIRDRDCTNCLECLAVCPKKGAMGIGI
jgi:polyferredoxin